MVLWRLMRTRLRRPAVWMRLFAATLVCLILADVALDGSCDPFPAFASRDAKLTSAGTEGTGDACADQCIPDCFCCSQGVAAIPATLPAVLGPAIWAPDLRAPVAPIGVRPIPYHPPLSLA